MRYIVLSPEEKQTLEQGFRNHSKHHFRQRCQAILLSGRGMKVKDIAALNSTRTRTVYFWMDRWEEMGLAGLAIQPGRGLKPALCADAPELVELVKKSPGLCPQPPGPVRLPE